MAPVEMHPQSEAIVPARILVVDDEPALLDLMEDVALRGIVCTIFRAATVQEACRIVETQPIDLMIADVHLPDGDGTSLLEILQLHRPAASAMIMTGAPSMERAVDALRLGAVDFLAKPFTQEQVVAGVRRALLRQANETRREKRMIRLKLAVKRLGIARRTINKKVDLLCNDLVTAYGELSRQIDGVRHQENFRKYISKAEDLEQLLCHSMDWLMRQLGYCNIAVWLAADDGAFQLGAYMKYTVTGEPLLTDALKRVVLPLAAREGLLHRRAHELAARLTPQEVQLLRPHDLLAMNCTYLGESLATVIFFRDARSSFSVDDETLLKSISPIFAIALATMVRAHGEEEASGDDLFLPGDTMEEEREREKPRRDPADWWKSGEEPPF
jgi:response regulator of citrate/malate metabolism